MMTNKDLNSIPLIYDWIEMSDLKLMLHLTKNTLKEWCSEGELKCCRVKNKVYFLRQDIERFMYSHYQTFKP
ncbi:MAG: helix-turn-helix domain-containing protein [Bacteroidales bacterium]|jgi:predicted site-specific integrase-resolvase|nr:helix-turn-helix domain-containing protein [Bacteroidales bacterium]